MFLNNVVKTVRNTLNPFQASINAEGSGNEKLEGKDNLYMSLSLTPECKNVFTRFIESIPMRLVDKTYSEKDIHCTLVYSKKVGYTGGDFKFLGTAQEVCTAYIKSLEIFGKETGKRFLVATLDSPALEAYNAFLANKFGLVSDFHSYRPHMTLAQLKPLDKNGDPDQVTLGYFLSLADKVGLALGGTKIELVLDNVAPVDEDWNKKTKSSR